MGQPEERKHGVGRQGGRTLITSHRSNPINPVAIKAACNRSHARKRGNERYGLSGEAVREIESRIRLADGGPGVVMLGPDHRGKDRALFAVQWEGRWTLPVFDLATDSIITFLPRDNLPYYVHVIDGRDGGVEEEADPYAASLPLHGLPPLPPDLPDDATPADYDRAIEMIAARRAEAHRRLAIHRSTGDRAGRIVLATEDEHLGRTQGQLRQGRHAATGRLEPKRTPILSESPDDVELFAAMLAAMRTAFYSIGWKNVAPEDMAVFRAAEARLRSMRRCEFE